MEKARLGWKIFLVLLINAVALINAVSGQKIALGGYCSYVLPSAYNAQYGTSDYLRGKTNDKENILVNGCLLFSQPK